MRDHAAAAVLHVVVAGEIGGAERMLLDLAKAAGRPHSIVLFTPNRELRALLHDAGLVVDDGGDDVREGTLPFLANTFGDKQVRFIEEAIARRGAKIVQLHTFASQVVGTRAAERGRCKVLRTEHSTRVYDDPSCWPFSRWSLKRADAVVCISDHVREVATRKASFLLPTSVHVVHNGIDVERFTPRGPAAPRGARVVEARVRFVALGRLDPRKGLDLALRALATIPNAELDIVGDGDARSDLEKLARQLGVRDRVAFSGYMKDVRDAIARADVAVSSARAEGLGIALLEAMAMGVPVVAVPTGGVVEIVRDGETGWLADERSVEALARAMRRSIDDPAERRRRGERARDRVVGHFSLASMRRGYEAIYASLEADQRTPAQRLV